jgi:AcrR family transcriptional regulator
VAGAWLRDAQTDLATETILDGAARAFVELGVSQAGMLEIAKYAGCSRGTLYRYFKNRHELHLAFVEHRAMRVAAELRVELKDIGDPHERIVETIMRAVERVRATPEMAAWFEPDESGMTARMSRGSEVIRHLCDSFVSESFLRRPDAENKHGLRARFLVRMIISLLTMPARDADEERLMVECFVAPAILADDRHGAALGDGFERAFE